MASKSKDEAGEAGREATPSRASPATPADQAGKAGEGATAAAEQQTQISTSRGFLDFLVTNRLSIALTSYQTGQLMLIGPFLDGRLSIDRQDFEGVARVTDDVGEGVIVATLGYWRSLNRSDGSVNCSRPMLSAGLGGRPLSRTISFRSFASTDATRLCGTPCAIRRWRSRSRLSFPAGR